MFTRKIARLSILVPTIALTALVAAASPATVGTADASGPGFELIATHSGKCIDVTDDIYFMGWFWPGGHVYQMPCDDTQDQRWQLKFDRMTYNPIAGRYDVEYLVRNAESGKCMDVKGWSRENGAQVQEYPCHGGANQRWRTKSRGYGESGELLEFISVFSNKCLDIYGRSPIDGAHAQQWACHGGSNQVFEMGMIGTP